MAQSDVLRAHAGHGSGADYWGLLVEWVPMGEPTSQSASFPASQESPRARCRDGKPPELAGAEPKAVVSELCKQC